MKKLFLLLFTHAVVAALGFAAGIYTLPILIAPPPPAVEDIEKVSSQAMYSGEFRRDLEGSDMFHWGEGTLSISKQAVSLRGRLAPGPDYKLYLSPEFVQTEAEFNRVKPRMTRAGDVKTFENFVVNLPESVDPAQFNTAIVWCETFGEFISAAKYQ